MAKYTSGRQKNLKIGISSYSENLTSLEVIGNVGIGTTNPTSKLDVRGNILISGVSTLGTVQISSGIITASSGIITYFGDGSNLTNVQATSSGIVTYADNAGIATNLKGGGPGYVPYQSGVNTTAFVNSSLASPGQVFIWNGSVPSWGNVSAASGAFGGISVRDEGASVGTANSITTLNFVGSNVSVTATSGSNGIATITFLDYVTNAGIATFATSSGIATFATSSGIATFATSSGIATFATNAGIATNLKGGGPGYVPYQSGVNTTAFVNSSLASPGQVFIWNGSVPSWGNVSAASGAFGGISVHDEGASVGTANSITTLNFVGSNVSVTATSGSNGIATITFANNLVGTSLSITGISTFTNGPILIGVATSTGTASQLLQVTGGAYISGNIGIGTTNPSANLDVVGGVVVSGIITANTFQSSSDINLKENIKTLNNSLNIVSQLRGVTFDWKNTNQASIGVIAQEVEKILPELVSGGEIKTVNYNGIIGVFVEAIKEQQVRIEELERKLNA